MIVKNCFCESCNNLNVFAESEDDTKCKYCGSTKLDMQSIEELDDSGNKIKDVWKTNEKPTIQINTPKCPYCQSTNLRKLDFIDRGLSFGIFGFGSKKIGKQWHCNNCKIDF